jgi:hypothetical protein
VRRKYKRLAGPPRHAIEQMESRLLLSTAAYTWQNVNIGAGGFVDGIFYDPHNQNTIYARTDIGGLYKTTNDGTTWTQLLDFVGNNTGSSGNGTQSQLIGVLSFAIDPENSNNLYADVGEYSGTNGAVFYSTNAGQTWSQTNLSFYVGGNSNGRGDGEQIAVDPNDRNIVFLGSNSAGLWESTNAGHSFSQVSAFSPTSATFVLFNSAGTYGNPSQTIYVGVDSTSSGTNLYQTTNGGSSWAQITGTGTLPAGYLPGHAVLSNGYLYLGYANAETPNGSLTNGGVYRYNISSGVWANISPKSTGGSFGYDAVAADPENPNTVVVTSFDYYSGPDQIWRTVNANATTPTWTELYDYGTALNFGYGGYDTTRNTTNVPWTAADSDGIGNWAATIAINPFNSNQLMYGTGEGIWATNNLSNSGANTQLTSANSWYFPDTGIEFTAVGGVAASTAGTPLYSAMGDIGGFANTTLAFSPAQGNVGGSANTTDYAGTNPNDAVIVGSTGGTNGVYTTNGTTFTTFAANPGGSTDYSGGTVAESASGSTIVWAPSGQAAYYSTNNGANWTLATLGATGALPTGGTIVADKVNANYFYYWTENSSDNSLTLYISTDGGHTFNASAGGSIGTGNATVAVNQYVAGQIWLGGWNGIYESTNFGAAFTQKVGSTVDVYGNDMAVGAPAPGSATPSIYIYGTVPGSSFLGIWRNDNGGVGSWVQLNSTSQQWGGLIQTLAADPNVFGRVYIGVNGRGIIMGNPASSLPTNSWSDVDINEPGNPGWATSSITLSTGSVVNQWNVNGGGVGLAATSVSISSLSVSGDVATAVSTAANGFQVGQMVTISGASNSVYDGTFVVTGLGNTSAGIGSEIGSATEFTFALVTANGTASGTIKATLADQFNYAYEPISGNASISAELLSLTNADNGNGTPQAGVMFRASTNASDPFFEMAQTSAGTLLLEYRTTTGGAVTTVSQGSASVGSEYVEVTRSGSSFSGYYSSNGTTWQLAATVAIAAMPATVNIGLAASASYNPQLTSAAFSNVTVSGLTVASIAASTPNPVTGTTAALSALGAENGSDAGLTYTWAATGPASVTYTGNTNGTNAAKAITANFTQAGNYIFTLTITDASAVSITSTLALTVSQTVTSITVSPSTSGLNELGTQAFTASAKDQFGATVSPAPTFTWSLANGGIGSINSINGLYTAPIAAGAATVQATASSVTGTAAVTVTNAAPTVATAAAANPSPVTAATTALSVLGADDGGESNLIYTWAVTGPSGVTYTPINTNGTNAAKAITANFTQAGSYNFTVTIKDSGGLTTTSTVAVTVNQTLTSISVSPSSAPLNENGTQLFSAVAFDQFHMALTTQPTIVWSLANGGVGGINSSTGLYTATTATGSATVQATASSIIGTAAVTVTNATPTVATPAAANPSPVVGTTTALSVLGADDGGQANLTYTWSTNSMDPTGVTYTPTSTNGTNAAQNITANFTQAGTYHFTVTITDAGSLSSTSSVTVTVNQTLTSITVTPGSLTLAGGKSQQFTATGFDQFSAVMNPEPTFSWNTTGGGTITGGSFAAAQVGGSYTITAAVGPVSGTAGVNVVPTVYSTSGVYYVAASSATENIWVGSAGVGNPTYTIPFTSLPSLTFNGDTNNDNLTVDYSGGDPIPSGGLAFNGGSAVNALTIIGTSSADTITVSPTNTTVNGDPITYSNLQSLAINGGAGADVITQSAANIALTISPTSADTLDVNAGTFSIPAPASAFDPYPLAALNIAGGSTVSLQSSNKANRTVLILGANPSIASTGTLDLGSNDMIVQNGDLPTVTAYLAQGRNGGVNGPWTGSGITSSFAAASPTLTALGSEVNDTNAFGADSMTFNPATSTYVPATLSGQPLVSTFDGQPVADGAVLIKYTSVGDADLSGVVDATDYLMVDNTFNYNQSNPSAPIAGWANGDFNYDGLINGDDYTLIDNTFNSQNQSEQMAAVHPLAEVADVSTTSPPHSIAASAVVSSQPTNSDDTLLKRRHRSLVQTIEQLED